MISFLEACVFILISFILQFGSHSCLRNHLWLYNMINQTRKNKSVIAIELIDQMANQIGEKAKTHALLSYYGHEIDLKSKNLP